MHELNKNLENHAATSSAVSFAKKKQTPAIISHGSNQTFHMLCTKCYWQVQTFNVKTG